MVTIRIFEDGDGVTVPWVEPNDTMLWLGLARAKLRGDDVLLSLDLANFQMSLDDMWDQGSTQEGT